MNRTDIRRIIFVLALLAPLVVLQIGPGVAPAWMSQRLGGVPLTVVCVALWFIAMMITAVKFGQAQVRTETEDKV